MDACPERWSTSGRQPTRSQVSTDSLAQFAQPQEFSLMLWVCLARERTGHALERAECRLSSMTNGSKPMTSATVPAVRRQSGVPMLHSAEL